MHQQVVVSRSGQGLRQQDAPLQVVDIVIEHRYQVFDPQNDSAIFVADLYAHLLGTLQNVLMLQIIE